MRINLTKTMVAAFVLAYCSICVSSCGKDDPQPVIEYDATFYLGVNPGDSDEACIYKDDELLYRLGSVSWVEGIALTPDGSIYASGSTGTRDAEDHSVATESPVIWKDGKPLNLDLTSHNIAFLYNMATSGDSWLCCGLAQEDGDTSTDRGIIICNGEVVYKSEEGIRFLCMDCDMGGDCYVVAQEGNSLSLLRISAGSWTLSSSEKLITGTDIFTWETCIHVGISNIAVGITCFEGDTNTAFCWVNDGLGLRVIDEESAVDGITFFRGHLVAAGCHQTITVTPDYLEFKSKAIQWVDGISQDFSLGCTGYSEMRHVSSWNDMFLFQCVEHGGGIQICYDGALLKEIKFTEKPCVSSWVVDVKPVVK